MVRLFRWIGDPPDFVSVYQRSGNYSGKRISGDDARKLQFAIDRGMDDHPGTGEGRLVKGNGVHLPPNWSINWEHEIKGPFRNNPAYQGNVAGRQIFRTLGGGRRHAFKAATPVYRTLSPQDVVNGRAAFERTWNGVVKWRPIGQVYVWCSHVWDFCCEVEEDDAEMVFFSMYGELRDVTHCIVRDDPAVYYAGY